MDTKTIHPFTPAWREDEEKPPRYMFRAGSVIERAQMEAELAGEYDAGRVFAFEMVNACRQGVMTLLAEDPERDRLIELIDRDGDGKEVDAADRQALVTARGILSQHWPEYRELLARKARRMEIAPIVVFRRFCTGWENVEVPYKKGADGQIAEDCLADVDPLEIRAAGNFGYRLLYETGDRRNFPQPSPSEGAPKISASAVTSSEAGKSARKSGRKTRVSRSRAGSGASSTSGS